MSKVTNKQLIEFIEDPANRDFIEQVNLYTAGIDGWVELSSGKVVYI